MIRSQNRLDLAPQQPEKILDIKAVPCRREGREILFREPKQAHRRIHPPAVFRVGRPGMLFLQMHKPARGLDEPLEVVCVLRFRLQPEMLEHIVRFVIALLVPATKEADVAGMLRDLGRHVRRRRGAQFFHQPGNSLAFVHGKLSLGSAEMTGNRARIVFPRRAGVRTAAGDG